MLNERQCKINSYTMFKAWWPGELFGYFLKAQRNQYLYFLFTALQLKALISYNCIYIKTKSPDVNRRLFIALKRFWVGILIVTAVSVITRRYSQISCTSLKDAVTNHYSTVIINKTDGDGEATIPRPSFFSGLWFQIKAHKITLEATQLSVSSWFWWALYVHFLFDFDGGSVCGF